MLSILLSIMEGEVAIKGSLGDSWRWVIVKWGFIYHNMSYERPYETSLMVKPHRK